MKAAIVGAAGFLGRALCKHLRTEGWEVVAYDAVPPPTFPSDTQFIPLDVVGDSIALPRDLAAVYYLAQSPRYRDFPAGADDLFGVNAFGAIKTAQAAAAAGAGMFCFASTGNVYRPSLLPRDEDCPVRRDDPYAASKLAAEDALRLFAACLPTVSVRLFGLFGPGQQKMLPATLLRKVQSGEAISLEPAEGESGEPEGLAISFSYVDDTARCLRQLSQIAHTSPTSLPAILNVAGPEAVSVRRFASTIGRILGVAPKFEIAKTRRAFNLIADIGRLRSLVDATFLSFDEAMRKTYAG